MDDGTYSFPRTGGNSFLVVDFVDSFIMHAQFKVFLFKTIGQGIMYAIACSYRTILTLFCLGFVVFKFICLFVCILQIFSQIPFPYEDLHRNS